MQRNDIDFRKDVREDLGYSQNQPRHGVRPSEPWSSNVIKNSRAMSPLESPLKEWWKSQQHEKR